MLPKVATRLGDGLRPAFEIDATVDRLAEALTGRRPRSVLLVGPSGVGKSAAFRELVRTAARRGLALRESWSTDGARLMAGAVGLGGWQDRCRALCLETAKRECIVHLGRLAELIEVGRCGGSSGVGEFLRPSRERGELLAVAERTPEEPSVAARDHPGLVEAFRPLVLSEPLDTVRSILEHEARRLERRTGTKFEGEALAELERRHRRYATGSVVPGRPRRSRGTCSERPTGSCGST